MELNELIQKAVPIDEKAMESALHRWSTIAKPLGSLGLLEEAVVKISGMTGTSNIDISKKAIVVMCADNGVAAQGVSQSPMSVTAVVSENMSTGATSVCRMARLANAEVIPVNIGCATEIKGEKVRQRCVKMCTDDFTQGPAMTRDEAEKAIMVGIDIVRELSENGVNLIATGEMGIANTTTSSAVISVIMDMPVAEVTGRGAGLSSEGLARKINAIERGIAINKPDKNDAIDVLSKVGGLDLAGLCGVFIGGAIYRIPILVDGFISSVAGLCAKNLCPISVDYMIASHASSEPAGNIVIEKALGLKPFLYAGMRLGEGTGAVAAMPIIDMGVAVYKEMSTFEDISIDAYVPLV